MRLCTFCNGEIKNQTNTKFVTVNIGKDEKHYFHDMKTDNCWERVKINIGIKIK